MKKLEGVSLVCIDCYNYGSAVSALQKSMVQNEFDKVLFLTDIPVKVDGIEVIQIPSIKSKREYSEFVIKQLYKYITTAWVLHIQHDGYTLNGDLFDERLYQYDWAGALWLESDGYANGNGGYKWVSQRLLEVVGTDDNIKATHPEDAQICRTYRDYLEINYGLKWATDEICEGFSFELREPCKPTMGFHGNFHLPYQSTVILKRSAAIGDIIIMEPIMRYYAIKGYSIVVDIPGQFFPLFENHYFPVKHISQFDRGRITPEKEVNLDMAYEVKPNQNYLKSYFEFCGIEDYELTRPQLYPLVGPTKLFKKYAVIHIDVRDTPHRNTYGVDWKRVQWHLEGIGYTVIQVGSNKHEVCGLEINTDNNLGLLKFIIGGCDIFIGVDSSPAGIAMAYNKPCVLLFGSVNPAYIHPDLKNTIVIQQPCDKQHCWHQIGGTAGKKCVYDELKPPCCISSSNEVINAINTFHK